MKVLNVLLIAAGIAAVSASSSSASTTYATFVDYTQGTGITDSARTVTSNALGAPDGKFLSLGLGGSAVFSFNTDFTGPAAVVEITNVARSGYVETAEVYVGTGYDITTKTLLGSVLLGSINNSLATAVVAFSGIYNFFKIVDTSQVLADRDGFDIDSVSVTAVPLPAGIALLGSGIALLGFAGRRRKRTTVAA